MCFNYINWWNGSTNSDIDSHESSSQFSGIAHIQFNYIYFTFTAGTWNERTFIIHGHAPRISYTARYVCLFNFKFFAFKLLRASNPQSRNAKYCVSAKKISDLHASIINLCPFAMYWPKNRPETTRETDRHIKPTRVVPEKFMFNSMGGFWLRRSSGPVVRN